MVKKSLGESFAEEFNEDLLNEIEAKAEKYQADIRKKRELEDKPGYEHLIKQTDEFVKRIKEGLIKFVIGNTYNVEATKDYNTVGVLTKIIYEGTGEGSPAAPSRLKFQFALVDPIQSITMPLSKEETNMTTLKGKGLTEEWDELLPKETRETRFLVTGNLLEGYQAFTGETITYTDEEGNYQDGILIPKSNKEIHIPDVKVGYEEAYNYFTSPIGQPYVTSQEVLFKKRKNGDIILQVPGRGEKGKKYFQDDILLQLVKGGEFFTQGSFMSAVIPENFLKDTMQRVEEISNLKYSIPTADAGEIVKLGGEMETGMIARAESLATIKKHINAGDEPKTKQAMVEVGKGIWNDGHRQFKPFQTEMGNRLSEVWDKVRKFSGWVWQEVKRLWKNQEGFIRIPVPELVKRELGAQELKDAAFSLTQSWDGLKKLLLPSTRGKIAKHSAEILREQLAIMENKRDKIKTAFQEYHKMFGKMPDDFNLKFMQWDDTGIAPPGFEVTPELEKVAKMMKDYETTRIELVRSLKPNALQELREHYFPHIWKRTANSMATIVGILTRRPFEGSKAFLKKRIYDDVLAGIEAGLVPVSWNPVDIWSLKMAEIDKFIMANQTMNLWRLEGYEKFLRIGKKVPEGWRKIKDPYGTVWGKPVVKVKEAFDEIVMDKLDKLAKDLGISERLRVTKIKGKRGVTTWGMYVKDLITGKSKTLTRFASIWSVFAHEIGHHIDVKYGLSSWTRFGETAKELRKLADLQYEGKEATQYFKRYVRKAPEKIANMVMAFVYAPDKMKAVAPVTYDKFLRLIDEHAELKPILDINPSLVLGTAEAEIPVGGAVIRGYRIATEEAAQILHNYLSPSIYSSPYVGKAFQTYMGAANTLNQFQLGVFSMFHAGFTTGEAVISRGALGIKQFYRMMLGQEKPSEVAKTFLSMPFSIVNKPLLGQKLMRELQAPLSQGPEMAEIAKAWLAGGGQLKQYMREMGLWTRHTQAFGRAWANKRYISAALRSPFAFVEQTARPIMEWLVPRQKAGVFAELMAEAYKVRPNMSHDELRSIAGQIINRIDARLGQVIYTRLFANNTAKNVIQALVRAPGWTGGTIVELGGAPKDTVTFIKEWIDTGKAPIEFPDRVAYTISLLVTAAAINGILTALFTGEEPEDRDFWAFRTGGIDEAARPERFVLPLYTKDIYHYTKHPTKTLLAKTHPLIHLMTDIVKNKDYYGTEIRHQDDPFFAELSDVMKYSMKAFTPFWVRGAKREHERQADPLRMTLPLFGIMPSPTAFTKTEAERKLSETLAEKRPIGARTKEEFERADLKRKLRIEMQRTGKKAHIFKAVREKQITMLEAKKIIKSARYTPLVGGFKKLDIEEAIAVWKQATSDERRQLRRFLIQKRRKLKNFLPVKRKQLREKLNQALKLR
jgi:hypothetical protein